MEENLIWKLEKFLWNCCPLLRLAYWVHPSMHQKFAWSASELRGCWLHMPTICCVGWLKTNKKTQQTETHTKQLWTPTERSLFFLCKYKRCLDSSQASLQFGDAEQRRLIFRKQRCDPALLWEGRPPAMKSSCSLLLYIARSHQPSYTLMRLPPKTVAFHLLILLFEIGSGAFHALMLKKLSSLNKELSLPVNDHLLWCQHSLYVRPSLSLPPR